jgi:spermidine synthase
MQSVTAPCAKQATSAIRAALALVGFSAVIGQIVLMRELIVVFNGNEISLGIMLATWLFWTAAGSSLAGRFALGGSNACRAVAALECLLGMSLPPTIWMLRASRTFFQAVPGELVGPAPMLLTSLVCLSVFCFISGALFVVATRMYQRERDVSARIASSSAYLLEAAGSALGGLLASIVLLRFFDSFQIAAVVLVMNMCMAAILSCRMGRGQVVAGALVTISFAALLLMYVAPSLARSSQQRLWQGFRLVGSRDSIYGKLAVTETGNIRSIYDNGVILANAPDLAAAEEGVHYALLEHPAPRQVLLVGGGVNGSIAQALEHPTLERMDYVELDPALIGIARKFFPEQSAFLSDPRVDVHSVDGRHYLGTARDKFDVIILNLPDPQTAQLNRFYTEEFFRSAADHLAPQGLLALQLRSSEDYISPDLAEFLRCIHHTVRQVFPYIAVIPGETIHFFAAMQPDLLTENPQTLVSRLQDRKLQTEYVREYFIPFRMMPDRMEQIREQLRDLPSTPVNRDFKPIAYYFDVVLWSGQFHSGYARWFRAAAHLSFTRIIDCVLIVLLCVAVVLVYGVVREKRARAAATFCMAATGFTVMALQIFVLLAFQSFYGYVYHQLAILIAMFMAGMAMGSWLGVHRIRSSGKPHHASLAATQLLLAISGPVLLFFISRLSHMFGATESTLIAQLVFPALAAVCGMLGGYQFPIATEIYLHDSRARASLGTLYAVDLLGGCAGALLLSTYVVPVFGFWNTAWLSAAVNLAPALLAVRVGLERSRSRV